MARLPTVKLKRKNPDGTVSQRIENVWNWQRDIASYASAGWRVVSLRHGDATHFEELFAMEQDFINAWREERTTIGAPRKQRRFDERRIILSGR